MRILAALALVVLPVVLTAADPVDTTDVLKFHREWRDKITAAHLVASKESSTQQEKAEPRRIIDDRDKVAGKLYPRGTTVQTRGIVREVVLMSDNPETGDKNYLVRLSSSDKAILPSTADRVDCHTTDHELVERLRLGQAVTLRGKLQLVDNTGWQKGRDRSKDPGLIVRLVDCIEAK